MSNSKVLLSNLRVGDLILFREKDAPMVEKVNGVAKTVWHNVHLHLGEELTESKLDGYSVALFRIKPELTKRETLKLVWLAKIYPVLFTLKQWLWKLLFRKLEQPPSCQSIAHLFELLGRRIDQTPAKEMRPYNYDESSVTVRIV